MAVADGRVHQQTPVTGEEAAIFAGGNIDQSSILGVALVGDGAAKQTQVANHFSEVTISDKLSDLADLETIFWIMRGDIGIETMDIDHSILGQDVVESSCLAIYQNQINLRVRYATRLYRILERRALVELPHNSRPFRPEKARQVAVEIQLNRERHHRPNRAVA